MYYIKTVENVQLICQGYNWTDLAEILRKYSLSNLDMQLLYSVSEKYSKNDSTIISRGYCSSTTEQIELKFSGYSPKDT